MDPIDVKGRRDSVGQNGLELVRCKVHGDVCVVKSVPCCARVDVRHVVAPALRVSSGVYDESVQLVGDTRGVACDLEWERDRVRHSLTFSTRRFLGDGTDRNNSNRCV